MATKDKLVLDHLHDITDEIVKNYIEPIAKVSSIYYDICGSLIGDYADNDEQEQEIEDKIAKDYNVNFKVLGKNPPLGMIALAIIQRRYGTKDEQ